MITTKKHWRILAFGLLLVGSGFILNHFMEITDLWTDFLKGMGVGIVLGSFFLMVRYNRKLKSN